MSASPSSLTHVAEGAGEAPQATLVQFRAWLTRQELEPGARLPPEREMCEILGVSRGELRKALAELQSEGQLWRHVGKGTFLGSRQISMMNLADIDRVTTPAEVMQTRVLIEPILAREAALHSSHEQIEGLAACIRRSQAARTWRQYETTDNEFHRLIAVATGNRLLLALFDALNAVRRAVTWGMLRPDRDRPPADHHSFAEHDRILAAIGRRDMDGAAQEMEQHVQAVRRSILDSVPAARTTRAAGSDMAGQE